MKALLGVWAGFAMVLAIGGLASQEAHPRVAGSPAASEPAPPARASKGPRPPVVLLILDEFPADLLVGSDGHIDATRFPNFARLAATSSWFPRATTVFDETKWAVPAIMDARLPSRNTRPVLRDHPRNIYTLLGGHGYRIVDSEEGTALCPPRRCPGAGVALPPILRNLLGGRPDRLRRWISSIRASTRPALYVKHAFLPHKPWIYLPSGRQVQPADREPLPGLNSTKSFHDPYLLVHNQRRQLLQLGFLDRELGRMLRRLRRTGLLDRAVLVVTADHGYAWELGVKDRRRVTSDNVDEVAPVPLFVKLPRQRKGRVDLSYARTIDIVPTIADAVGVRVRWPHEGRSVFSRAVRRRRVVRLRTRDFSHVIKIDSGTLEARRAANVRRRAQLFGTGAESSAQFGDPWAAVYRAGPHPELLGRSPADAGVQGGGDVRARIVAPSRTRSLRLRSGLMPTHIAGQISGGDPGTTRDVAVSVNGRIWALGRTFRLRGQPTESFSVLVPERALRSGRNDVEVFAVAAAPGSLVLTPLGNNG